MKQTIPILESSVKLSLACLLTSHSPAFQAVPGDREGSWSNTWEGKKWPPASTCLFAPLSHKQVERKRRKRESSVGAGRAHRKVSSRQLAPASRKRAGKGSESSRELWVRDTVDDGGWGRRGVAVSVV